MKLKNILIVVDNIEESIHFYNELFGLNVISRQVLSNDCLTTH